jgi:hypothetical protein
MPKQPPAPSESHTISRKELIGVLNEDLAREYQAIIAYEETQQLAMTIALFLFAGSDVYA